MAVDDDILRKNPFKFKLSDVVPRDAYVRTALSREQQEQYLQFFMEYGGGSYYDDVVILLGTGLRLSELYGLTKSDLDFDRRCIHAAAALQNGKPALFYQQSQDQERYSHHSHDRHGVYGSETRPEESRFAQGGNAGRWLHRVYIPR